MSVMSAAEFFLWLGLSLVFWRRKLNRTYKVTSAFLVSHVFSVPVFTGLMGAYTWTHQWIYLKIYFYLYWGVYIASAIVLFFVCTEVFGSALAALPGIKKLGTLAFRWVAFASIIITLTSISYAHASPIAIKDVALGLMRSVSVLELCLLAFLCVSLNALKLSVRDAAFGISFGLGLFASNDFVVASIISRNPMPNSPVQFAYEGVILAVLGGWVTFFALPEPVRKPVLLPASSFIFRWNEIATALGHGETQIALQTADSSLLSDVQQVADRIFAHKMGADESES